MLKGDKRYKVSFGEVKFEEMDPNLVAEAKRNISKVMKPLVMEYKRKQFLSTLEASKCFLNA